jgi:DNA-binding MarR family transcriptional regulator
MNNSFESFELSTELIFQRFLMDKERRKNFYNGLELADCIDGKDKTYLKDLSSFMRISIPQTSAIASSLKDMGYALWKHDGKGTDGTYLVFTDAGRDFLKKREDNNREYYGNVIAELGEERTTQILSDMRTLVEAMEHASKKMHFKEAE